MSSMRRDSGPPGSRTTTALNGHSCVNLLDVQNSIVHTFRLRRLQEFSLHSSYGSLQFHGKGIEILRVVLLQSGGGRFEERHPQSMVRERVFRTGHFVPLCNN